MNFETIQKKLSDEREFASENFVPIIREKSAEFLYNFVKENNYEHILEIGTAIGYSGSLMLCANHNAKLTTIELREDYFKISQETFQKLGCLDRVKGYLADAKTILTELMSTSKKFDMIFLDGPKGQYINYLPLLEKLLNRNGVILADNVLFGGLVCSEMEIPKKNRTIVNRLRMYIEAVSLPPFETTFIDIEDGLAITKFKGENND